MLNFLKDLLTSFVSHPYVSWPHFDTGVHLLRQQRSPEINVDRMNVFLYFVNITRLVSVYLRQGGIHVQGEVAPVHTLIGADVVRAPGVTLGAGQTRT